MTASRWKDTWRAHQVPLAELREKPEHLRQLEEWMRSYKPEELFDDKGRLRADLAEIAPKGRLRMGMNAHANGGLLLQPLMVPNFRDFAVKIEGRGQQDVESTRVLGHLLHAVMQANKEQKNFRVFGPDETASNRLQDVITGTGKAWMAETLPVDENFSPTGRVMEVLSEHLCQGWLEGYLLTGRHGFFNCYEAFIHIIDSMANQHAKWLKTTREIPWRKPIASLNYLLSSLVWRQDHNGFSHQDPGFIDHLVNKKADVVRIYLPPDANTLLSVADHCLRSRNYINLIVAGKQPAPQWLTIDEAIAHCTTGLGVWEWASKTSGKPEVVMACCGDVPTMEALAAVILLRERVPDLRIRVVNVVDLMALQPQSEHPHGLPDEDTTQLFPGVPTSLLSTAIRGAFTGSLTGGTTTTTCTCADTRKKAPPPLLSTCACSTISIAFSLRWTRSAACQGSRRKSCSRSSGTPNRFSGTSSTWRKTATICRRSRIGAGRRTRVTR